MIFDCRQYRQLIGKFLHLFREFQNSVWESLSRCGSFYVNFFLKRAAENGSDLMIFPVPTLCHTQGTLPV